MAENEGSGFFGRMTFNLFGSGTSAQQGVVDMTVTGEGCQPISDLGWRRKENKYLGASSMSERELKEQKAIKGSVAIE